MDVWIVGKTPIGIFQPPEDDTPTTQGIPDVSISPEKYFM